MGKILKPGLCSHYYDYLKSRISLFPRVNCETKGSELT